MAMGIATEDVDPVMGDHRPQYLDINVNGLLKLNIHNVCSPMARKLKSSNPKNVEIYLKKWKKTSWNTISFIGWNRYGMN